MTEHRFGGDWTQEKLGRVAKYLPAYTRIFHANERAQFLNTVYVDAFAGTGYITPRSQEIPEASLFPEFAELEAQQFLKGSAQIALETEPPFDHYVFVEKEASYAEQLHRLRLSYYEMRHKIEIVNAEANSFLKQWCDQQDWQKQRAVVLLDPYSLEVDWNTLQTLAATKSVDLWLLWPIGQAVNRLLTKKALPPPSWGNVLTRVFGTEEWKDRFYHQPQQAQLGLFGETTESAAVKAAGFQEIERFFVERLQTLFEHVAQNPLYLFNSQNVPLYLLCFAAHNPRAVKIAQDILKN